MKAIRIELSYAEATALRSIVYNGWGDGDFSGYGGEFPHIQRSAIRKLEDAIETVGGKFTHRITPREGK